LAALIDGNTEAHYYHQFNPQKQAEPNSSDNIQNNY